MKKIVAIILVLVFMLVSLSGCKPAEPESEYVPIYPMPSGCTLTEEEIHNSIVQYTEYISSALSYDGYHVEFDVYSDGTCALIGRYDAPQDAETDSDTQEQSKDVTLLDFASQAECYGYLYQCQQVDINGNLIKDAGVSSNG